MQECWKVGKQCAVDDLDASAERVDVVGKQRKVWRRNISGCLEDAAVVLQNRGGIGKISGEVAEVVDRVAGCRNPWTVGHLLDELDVRALQRVNERRGELVGPVRGAEGQC